MPLRTPAPGDEAVSRFHIPEDPLARFHEIYASLNGERGWWEDATPLRFAAVTTLTSRVPAPELARAIRTTAEDLKQRVGWFDELRTPLRFILGAILLQNQDTPAAFLEDLERITELFRAAGLRRGHAFEKIAALILRTRLRQDPGRPVQASDIARFKALYEQMKRYHWWLTGPDDFPCCAMLTTQPGAPEAIGEGVEAVYQALHKAGLSRGDPLQTAANLLYMTGLTAEEIGSRVWQLLTAFKARSVWITQQDYDELATLCFLAQPVERIADLVIEYRDVVRELSPSPGANLSFTIAVSIAFVRLVGRDEDMRVLADAKAMLDMQAVLAAQQATAVAAATAASSAAS